MVLLLVYRNDLNSGYVYYAGFGLDKDDACYVQVTPSYHRKDASNRNQNNSMYLKFKAEKHKKSQC